MYYTWGFPVWELCLLLLCWYLHFILFPLIFMKWDKMQWNKQITTAGQKWRHCYCWNYWSVVSVCMGLIKCSLLSADGPVGKLSSRKQFGISVDNVQQCSLIKGTQRMRAIGPLCPLSRDNPVEWDCVTPAPQREGINI